MAHIAVIGRHRPYSGGYLPEEPFISEGLRKIGVHVSQIDIHTLSDADAINYLRRYSVDVALFTHATIGRSVEFWERVAELRALRHRVLWTPDVILYGGRPEQYASRAPYFDLILHPEDEDLSEHGISNALYFCAAATPSEDSAVAINWNANKHDLTCAFFGNIYDDQRKDIVDRLTRNFGRRFKVFSMANRTGVYGAELARICSTTKVVVGINARNNLQGYWSDRMYQIPAHGGFLLAPKVPGIESHLTPGEHFVTYDSIESIPNHVMHWSRNAQERERIRQAGFHHVRKWHTWDQRAIELLSILSGQRMLASTSVSPTFRIVVPVFNAKDWITKCLRSIREQSFKHFTCVVVDDASTDGTADIARRFCSADPRFTFIGNESNVGALANIIRGIDEQRPDDQDVIVTVDGDDWLAHEKVFQRLIESYRSPHVQLTYGQFLQISSGEPGWCREYPEEVIKRRSFRQHSWVASHLRTFRYRLWRQINREHLNDPLTGKPWAMAWDVAMMVPMLEMCEEGQYEYIPEVLYIYNDGNPINDHKVDRQKQVDMDQRIRALPSYASNGVIP